ncbi:MAG: hypothetical protein EOP41_04685 [Sphingobacteriaceae bacterium]|nr:MAG: hypothetical protein EOP41_04685 [Sphingobacteriaceae bacterium]
MPVKNNIVIGVLIGLMLPLLAYFLADVIFKDQIFPAKPGALYLITVGLNLVLMRILYKAKIDKTAIGILLVCFFVLILTFIFKIKLR